MPWSGGTYSKSTTFVTGGELTGADLNGIQDDLGNQIETLMAKEGVSETSLVRRGKSIIATTQTTTSGTYTTLTTPDRVQNVFLPTDGLIVVCYKAQWGLPGAPGSNAARAALFLGANQVKVSTLNAAPAVQETTLLGNNTTLFYTHLGSSRGGLISDDPATVDSSDVTTGQVVGFHSNNDPYGGFTLIQAASGTYDVSVRFRISLGANTLSVRNRRLWVFTLSF